MKIWEIHIYDDEKLRYEMHRDEWERDFSFETRGAMDAFIERYELVPADYSAASWECPVSKKTIMHMLNFEPYKQTYTQIN